MNGILLFLCKWLNKPVKGFPAVQRISFDQRKQGTVAGAKLPVIHKGVNIHGWDTMFLLPSTVDVSYLSDAKHPLLLSFLLLQNKHVGTSFCRSTGGTGTGVPRTDDYNIRIVGADYLIR